MEGGSLLELYLALFVMLASAWALGEALRRVGQPALVGQLLAGVLVGPSVLNLIQPSASDLTAVENVALFFIMLLTGLAIKPAKVIAAGRRGALVSSVSFVIPFAGAFEVAQLFGVGTVSALTVALTVSITAVPVNSIILMELGLLDTDLGAAVIAAGVIDDVVSFVVLSVIQQFGGNLAAGAADVAWDVAKVLVFLIGVLACEHVLRTNMSEVRRWMDRLSARMKTRGSYVAFLIVAALGISLVAEWCGLQFVIGAFFAGLLLSEVTGAETLEKTGDVISGATFGFFGPLAFSFIGAELVLSSIAGSPLLVGALLAVAVTSKLVGGTLGARLAKFPSTESVVIGFLMNSRGFVELVIATTAYQLGLIDTSLFSIVVGIGIVTTIMSPVASRAAIGRMKGRPVSATSAAGAAEPSGAS